MSDVFNIFGAQEPQNNDAMIAVIVSGQSQKVDELQDKLASAEERNLQIFEQFQGMKKALGELADKVVQSSGLLLVRDVAAEAKLPENTTRQTLIDMGLLGKDVKQRYSSSKGGMVEVNQYTIKPTRYAGAFVPLPCAVAPMVMGEDGGYDVMETVYVKPEWKNILADMVRKEWEGKRRTHLRNIKL